jgi:hypothetical protein
MEDQLLAQECKPLDSAAAETWWTLSDRLGSICEFERADNDFFNQIIRPAVQNMNIDQFYNNNPSVMEHTFTVQIDKGVTFYDSQELHFSLKHATISFILNIYTERGLTIPEITGVGGGGICIDFYDFRTYGSDENNGWASRVQSCHTENFRDAGEVFSININLSVPETHFWFDIYYNDIDGLKSKWQSIFD